MIRSTNIYICFFWGEGEGGGENETADKNTLDVEFFYANKLLLQLRGEFG